MMSEDDANATETAGGERPEARRPKFPWGLALAVAVFVVYPAVRWTFFRSSEATPRPVAGARELQQSFEHYQAGRYQEAIVSAKAALEANPRSADAHNNLAVSYMALGQIDAAILSAREALRLRPDFQIAKNNLAWFEREKAQATAPPRSAGPSAQAAALLNQSLEHYQARRFRECLDDAMQAIRLDARSARAFNNAGICAANLQRWDEALGYTQEAIRLDPGFQVAKNNLAWIEQEKMNAGMGKVK